MTEWARTKSYGDWWFVDNYVTHKHKLHSRIMVLCSQFPDLWSFTLLLTKLQWNKFHINYISRHWLKVTRLACLIACLGVMRLSMSCPTYPMSCTGGDYWGFARVFDKFPILGDNLMLQIPYILYRDSKTIKILGQMPQPWGQIMLTNRYKSPPITQPGVGGVDNDRCIMRCKKPAFCHGRRLIGKGYAVLFVWWKVWRYYQQLTMFKILCVCLAVI